MTYNRSLKTSAESSITQRNQTRGHLIVFARVPALGKAKTRLIPAVGEKLALEIYEALLSKTLITARKFARDAGCKLTIYFCGGTRDQATKAFGREFSLREQVGADLGERLKNAVHESFDNGYKRVLVIGTDCPDLSPEDLSEAFRALNAADVALGPACDGGYYLIGQSRYIPDLYMDVEWGSEKVLQQTIDKAGSLAATCVQLRTLSDIDNPEDLIRLRTAGVLPESVFGPIVPGKLSIVIPTLNEAQNLPTTLRALEHAREHIEVIVADAGSNDGTKNVVDHLGWNCFQSRKGRGIQLNAGAALATGEFIMFLHADTIVPPSFYQDIVETLSGKSPSAKRRSTGATIGAFRLKIDCQGVGYRLLELAVIIRSSIFGMPYGDQAFFMYTDQFFKMQGFKQIPIMEDVDFIQRARKQQAEIVLTKSKVSTSARRWKSKGILRTTLINFLCRIAYQLGVSPSRIRQFYYGRR